MAFNEPKRDGSGKDKRLNKGRGGCIVTKEKGQAYNREK